MKKIFLMAFAALSLSAMAQNVTPLNIQLYDFKVDSLRALYMSEPIMYRAALDAVAQQLAKNGEEIKAAKQELKTEQAHAKEKASSLKDAMKMTASLKKLYEKEDAEVRAMQKVVEKQQKTLNKQKELNQETRDAYAQLLEQQQKELGYALREIAERMRSTSDIYTAIQNSQTDLQAYEQQVAQKAHDLSLLEAELKARQTSVKAEQKAAKSMQ
jgi:chromosome segregation ATPase